MQGVEQQIVTLIEANDPRALELIYDTYADQIYGFLLGRFSDRREAEEVLHRLFLAIATNREKLLKAKRLADYLFIMARNEVMDYYRELKRHPQISLETMEPVLVSADDNETNRQEETKSLSQALKALPADQRIVIWLKFYMDKSFIAMSKMLGISQNTAASRYRYGMEKLKTLLCKEQES
jgi:RNA polymerase sigma-70 factor (ECF subfamily)